MNTHIYCMKDNSENWLKLRRKLGQNVPDNHVRISMLVKGTPKLEWQITKPQLVHGWNLYITALCVCNRSLFYKNATSLLNIAKTPVGCCEKQWWIHCQSVASDNSEHMPSRTYAMHQAVCKGSYMYVQNKLSIVWKYGSKFIFIRPDFIMFKLWPIIHS